jgi:hypothetical protein
MNYNVVGSGGFYKTREALEKALKESRGSRRCFLCPCCKEKIPWQEVLRVLRPNGFMTYFKVKIKDSGEELLLKDTDINPETMEIIA